MFRRYPLLAVSILVSSIALPSTTRAQDSKQPPANNAAAARRRPAGVGGSLPTAVYLLSMEEVRTELGITAEQRGLLEDVTTDLREAFRNRENYFADLRKNVGSTDTLSDEEKAKRKEAFTRKVEDLAAKVADAGKQAESSARMVLDDKQLARLEQLRMQLEGPASWENAEIAMRIGLSEEQRTRLREIREAARSNIEAAFKAGTTREERAQAFSKDRRDKTREDMFAVLTAEQKAKWDEMQGKKFTFPDRPVRRNPAESTKQKPQNNQPTGR